MTIGCLLQKAYALMNGMPSDYCTTQAVQSKLFNYKDDSH